MKSSIFLLYKGKHSCISFFLSCLISGLHSELLPSFYPCSPPFLNLMLARAGSTTFRGSIVQVTPSSIIFLQSLSTSTKHSRISSVDSNLLSVFIKASKKNRTQLSSNFHLLYQVPQGHIYNHIPSKFWWPLEGALGVTTFLHQSCKSICESRALVHKHPKGNWLIGITCRWRSLLSL